MTRNASTLSLKDSDTHVMGEINQFLETVLSSAQLYDMELQKHCIKFQVEHASSKAAFQRRSRSPFNNSSTSGDENAPPKEHDEDDLPLLSPEMDHLQQTLKRMLDLSATVAAHVLRTTTQLNGSGSQSPLGGSFTSARQASPSPPSPSDSPSFASPESAGMASFRASSVDDISMDEAWMECGAHLMHCCVEIMGLVLIVHEGLRSELQLHLINNLSALRYIHDALSISKEHETSYYASGFRTNVMKLVANVSFENESTSESICRYRGDETSASLLSFILCSTKIDDDNPHLVEWAEFAIRNLMSSSEFGREEMMKMRAVSVDEGTRNLMKHSKVEHVLDVETGKVVTKKVS
ncbi:Hypothetical protein, putative [Bodo saltans]|uniref:Ataxin-10 domain-containing protein n=1 Tax=Bodo saltans TaxID=75058 RepID=A0A0S4KKL7_BODSA|nr:Hypothetical protein, putative [Bodo saltans]|eukprot:CUI15011.1 Hypothetical protein, putative [Bodo saltans]